VIGAIKALLFGISAGIVAATGGSTRARAEGVGDAVNQSVVISFILVYLINVVLTTVYLAIVPRRGADHADGLKRAARLRCAAWTSWATRVGCTSGHWAGCPGR